MKQFLAVVLMLLPLLPIAIMLKKFLAQGSWLLSWLRGCAIVGLAAVSCLFGLTAYEIMRLEYIPLGRSLAEIHIDDAVDDALVTIRYDGKEQSVLMDGDAVKVSARAVHFSGPVKHLIPDTFLKIDQVENRYFHFDYDESLKSIDVAKRAVAVPGFEGQFDGWLLLDFFKKSLQRIGIHRSIVSAEYIPMVRGSIYHLVWQGYGMEVVPANNPAYESLNSSKDSVSLR